MITLKSIYKKGVRRMAVLLLPVTYSLLPVGCSDEWDDHYGDNGAASSETLWQAISENSNLSNFKRVVEACGYSWNLNGSQTFSVFAPTNETLTAQEADSLIQEYNTQLQEGVKDDENTVVKQFVKNHISVFSKTVSSKTDGYISMMNGKYQRITDSSISGIPMQSKNDLYCNGVLYTVNQQLTYFPNVFEYLGKDKDIDSTYHFINKFSTYELDKSKSVVGGVVNGETYYLDSVMNLSNRMFSLLGEINAEDSSFIMVAPSNSEWTRLTSPDVTKYPDSYYNYFNYDPTVSKYDSLRWVNTRLALLRGTVFSRSVNSDDALADSAVSTNASSAAVRRALGGYPYYVYYKPYDTGNIFNGTTSVECSNGNVFKAPKWNANKFNTFVQTIKVEAETVANQDTIVNADDPLTVDAVVSSNPFYDKVSENGFVRIIPKSTSDKTKVAFKIPNVLSNVPYDIYVVCAPALATDTLAKADDRKTTAFRAVPYWHDKSGKEAYLLPFRCPAKTPKADVVDSVKVFSKQVFPTCSYGLSDSQVRLQIESQVAGATLRIDCIIFKPVE